jgi:predicted ribosomally synthesized peptide with nif11-like leader
MIYKEDTTMKEELKLFIQKLAEDKELQDKMQTCKSPEEAYAIASSVQEGFTFEEYTETMTKLYNEIKQGDQELTDEDLSMAAGGVSTSEAILSAVTVIGSAIGLPLTAVALSSI